jgi:pimeloyl-ACP methyl ester carboxylesterase
VVEPRSATPVAPPEPTPVPAATQPPRPRIIPEEQVITVQGQGGVTLGASWYPTSKEAPVLVLLHRLAGNRGDWQPLVQALRKEGPELSMLALDLRGHGQSGASEGRSGGGLQGKDIERMPEDLALALTEVERRLGARPTRLLGVGADLGATVLVLAANQDPRWSALALAAPVAGLRGVDLYRPFSALRQRSILLMAAREDPVSREPFQAMSGMVGLNLTTRQYEGTEHNFTSLAVKNATLWPELVTWLGGVAQGGPPPASSAAPSAAAPPSAAPAQPSSSAAPGRGPGGKK